MLLSCRCGQLPTHHKAERANNLFLERTKSIPFGRPTMFIELTTLFDFYFFLTINRCFILERLPASGRASVRHSIVYYLESKEEIENS